MTKIPAPGPMPEAKPLGLARHGARIVLGSFLTFAGISHLTFARQEFQAQVPRFVPLDPDLTVVLSGVAEIGLGLSLLVLLKSGFTSVGSLHCFLSRSSPETSSNGWKAAMDLG